MDSKTLIEVFVKYVRELSTEKYVKHINDHKGYSLHLKNQQLSETNENLPDEMFVRSFVSKFRDFFSNSSPYCVRKIRPILNNSLPKDKDIFEEYSRNETWWSEIQKKNKHILNINICENGVSMNKKRYTDLYSVYNEYLYAFYLHNDLPKRERLELLFAETLSKRFFYLFIDYGFKYLYKLECILTVAISRRIFDNLPPA